MLCAHFMGVFIFRFFPNLFYFSHENHRKITRKSQSPRIYFLAHSAILNKSKPFLQPSHRRSICVSKYSPVRSSLLVFFTCCNHAHKMPKCEYSCNMLFAHKNPLECCYKISSFLSSFPRFRELSKLIYT